MKTNKAISDKKAIIEIDEKLNEYAKMNLFKKKFDESTAILLRAKLSFK